MSSYIVVNTALAVTSENPCSCAIGDNHVVKLKNNDVCKPKYNKISHAVLFFHGLRTCPSSSIFSTASSLSPAANVHKTIAIIVNAPHNPSAICHELNCSKKTPVKPALIVVPAPVASE